MSKTTPQAPAQPQEAGQESAEAQAPVAVLDPAVGALVDEHWPLVGEDWQVRSLLTRRESFKAALATTITTK